MRLLASLAFLILFFVFSVRSDVYLHNPAGSCNRLRDTNEQGNGRQRDNANRLFDDQDNNRGGYEAPTVNSGRLYYYEKSIMTIEWTAQHACSNPNNNCDFVIQYMCDNAGLLRDGANALLISGTSRIPMNPDQCTNGDCDSDLRYGRHESLQYYRQCDRTIQNTGLFHADQNVAQDNNRNTAEQRGFRGSATRTRQDAAGNRYGYECPEERDYYPYWRPSPWRDIAIITSRPERCPAFQAESQNVKARMQCSYPNGIPAGSAQDVLRANGFAWIPITEADCLWSGTGAPWFTFTSATVGTGVINQLSQARSVTGVWSPVASWGIPKPECLPHSAFTRDNSLGNAVGGFAYTYNWTIPADYSENCVLRLRYNITTGDFNFNMTTGEWGKGNQFGYISHTSIQAGDLTSALDARNNNQNNGQFPARVPLWLAYKIPLSEMINPNLDTANVPQNGGTAPGYTRGYVLEEHPILDIFGPLLRTAAGTLLPNNYFGFQTQNNANNRQNNGNEDDPSWYTAVIGLRIAVNPDQFGRTFQDRTHTFAIRQRPAALRGHKIINVNVRGKRGNIVQTYPSVEHDFVPNRVMINNGELIHFQWMMSDYNSKNNAGEGTAGTSRSNIVIMREPAYAETGKTAAIDAETIGQWGSNYPGRIDTPNTYPFLGFSYIDLHALAYNGLNYSYFDLGPRQVTRAGIYHYMSTRNNDFSNRSQKGKITVLPNALPYTPLDWGSGASFFSTPAAAASTGSSSVYTAGAYLELHQTLFENPGTAVTQQEVWLQAFDNSGYDTPWIQVNPPEIQVTDAARALLNGDAPLWLQIPHTRKPLHDVTVWYKRNATTQELVKVEGVNDSGSTASVPIGGANWNEGGFYVVQLNIQQAYIAAIVIGAVLFIAIVSFLYWKVRIQPAGGFQSWLRERKRLKSGSNEDSQRLVNGPTSA